MTASATIPFPSFDDYFSELHGSYKPYDWQRELAEQIHTDGWPAAVEVPTGLGKTTTIAIAVYELARELHESTRLRTGDGRPPRRRAPQRIFHLVNRRVLVDHTHSYIRRFAEQINTAEPGAALHPVREALTTLLPSHAASEPAIVSAAIHGGAVCDDVWLRARGCTIVSLTPHQFVSRLLLRGFGVSPGTRPIHAGLVGIDRLVLLDEPHLSGPAYTTIRDAERLQARASVDLGIPSGTTVLLGATVPDALRGESDNTRRSPRPDPADPGIRARLHAPRHLTIATARTAAESAFVETLSREALAAHDAGDPSVVVFANTIDVAQAVYSRVNDEVSKRKTGPGLSSGGESPVRLITSRFRPLDRSEVPTTPNGITVTTQCLEVGVDVSFRALITEAASWNAIVQRLGRLNRDGSPEPGRAVLVTAASGSVRKGTAAVYGESPVRELLKVLTERAGESEGPLDVSSAALAVIHAAHEKELSVPLPRSGTLHRGLVPLMATTRPVPSPDLPVEALISGPDVPRQREVRVAWRATPSTLESSGSLAVASGEFVSLPAQVFGSFLLTGDGSRATLSDLDEAVAVEGREAAVAPLWLDGEVWVWHLRDERWLRVTHRSHVTVGDTFVLASSLGGYERELGWTGRRRREGQPEVPDHSLAVALAVRIDELQVEHRVVDQRAEWIITPATLETASELVPGLTGQQREQLRGYAAELRASWPEDTAAVDELLDEDLAVLERTLSTIASKLDEIVHERAGVTHRAAAARVSIEGILAGRVALRWRAPVQRGSADEVASVITLASHLAQVGEWAAADAAASGLAPDAVAAVRRAGLLHDLGKRDPRFQRLLAGSPDAEVSDGGVRILQPSTALTVVFDPDAGGTAAEAPGPERFQVPLLAKSIGGSWWALSSAGRATEQRLRARSGVPDNWRHEICSAAFARGAGEPPIVTHLSGSHHGWYRPGVPPVAGEQLHGFSHAAEFLELNDQYGPWGLAYLEAVLRLADWRASARPEQPSAEALAEAESLLRRYGSDAKPDGSGPACSGSEGSRIEGRAAARSITAELKEAPASNTSDGEPQELAGLLSHPVTGWYAAVGLLAVASERADPGARLRWRAVTGRPGDPPVLPLLTARDDLRTLVAHVFASPVWEQARDLVVSNTRTGDGLRVKNQKLSFDTSLRRLLLEAQDADADFLLGIAGDLEAAEGSAGERHGLNLKLKLLIPAYANNSSYPRVALDVVAQGSHSGGAETLAALTDVQRGYADDQCDGGFDRSEGAAYAVTGIGSADGKDGIRVSRTALAPLVLFGMAAIGNTGASAIGIGNVDAQKTLRVPLPERPVDLAELRALAFTVYGAGKWNWGQLHADALFEARHKSKGKSEHSWDARSARRGSGV